MRVRLIGKCSNDMRRRIAARPKAVRFLSRRRTREGALMSRIRHIAIIVPDAEEAAKFYEKALGLKRAGTARRGIYLSDGVINIALLKKEHENENLGVYQFCVWVGDLDASENQFLD